MTRRVRGAVIAVGLVLLAGVCGGVAAAEPGMADDAGMAAVTVYEQDAFPQGKISSYQGVLLRSHSDYRVYVYDSLVAYLADKPSRAVGEYDNMAWSNQAYTCPPDSFLRTTCVMHPDDPFLNELTWLERERLILGGRSDGQQYLVVYAINDLEARAHEGDPGYHGGAFRYAGMLGGERFDFVLLNLEDPAWRHNRTWIMAEPPVTGDSHQRRVDFGTSVVLLDGMACLYNYPRDLFCLIRSDGLMDWWELEEALAPHCESIGWGESTCEGCVASDGTYVYVGLGVPVQIWRFRPQWSDPSEWEVEFVGEIPCRKTDIDCLEIYQGDVLLKTAFYPATLYVMPIEAGGVEPEAESAPTGKPRDFADPVPAA